MHPPNSVVKKKFIKLSLYRSNTINISQGFAGSGALRHGFAKVVKYFVVSRVQIDVHHQLFVAGSSVGVVDVVVDRLLVVVDLRRIEGVNRPLSGGGVPVEADLRTGHTSVEAIVGIQSQRAR